MAWSKKASRERIKAAIKESNDVEVSDLTRETDLTRLPLNRAYRVQGAHIYVDISNAASLLSSDDSEGERSHKRYLRFLHVYQRVAHTVFRDLEVTKVDFQNQRLHFVVYKPYDDEKKRIAVAVSAADLLKQVIEQANEIHGELADAKVCVGVESGQALAVCNGTRGDREPLFLGRPANEAAKLLASGRRGIHLGADARAALGGSWKTTNPKDTPLTAENLTELADVARLGITVETLLKQWKEEVGATPLGTFSFSRPTPPLRSLDFETLTPSNSRRIDACSLIADIDAFTAFVARHADAGTEATTVQVLHVIRKELRDTLNEFGGKKVRYVGDCLQGVLALGDRETEPSESVSEAALVAGAWRDAFGVVQEELPAAATLGLAIGVDFGPISLTRLGVKGGRDRCSAGRAVLRSVEAQEACKGRETALGSGALAVASDAVKDIFDGGRKVSDLTYDKVLAALEAADERAVARSPVMAGISSQHIPRAHAR